MNRPRLYLAITATLLVLCCQVAMGGGGIYLDDVTIVNNGSRILCDTFDNGKLTDWTGLKDAAAGCSEEEQPQCALFLNRHSNVWAKAKRTFKLDGVAFLEFSFRVMLAPSQEQARSDQGMNAVYAKLYSGNSKYSIGASIVLDNGAPAAGVGVVSLDPNRNALSKQPVLLAATWATVTVRLDPSAGTCSAFVDGKYVGWMVYDPRLIRSVTAVEFICSLGDMTDAKK